MIPKVNAKPIHFFSQRTCAVSVSRLFLLAPKLASVPIGSHDSGAALAQP